MNTQSHHNQLAGTGSVQHSDSGGLEFISGQRSDSEFKKAVQHSQRVRKLKILLPIFAILIIVAIVGALIVRQFILPDLDIVNITLDDGKLVMENPNLNGRDQKERSYNLQAARAIQDAANPAVVQLEKISASLPMENEIRANVSAGFGVYDADVKTLRLRDEIQVETSDGMTISLKDADVDIKNGTLQTKSPIYATSRQADIASSSLFVEENGKRMIFEGKVRMTLRPKEFKNAEPNGN